MKFRAITAAATALCICLSMAACGSKSEEEKIEEKLESISEKDIDDALARTKFV